MKIVAKTKNNMSITKKSKREATLSGPFQMLLSVFLCLATAKEPFVVNKKQNGGKSRSKYFT